jgi:hypothetical protein
MRSRRWLAESRSGPVRVAFLQFGRHRRITLRQGLKLVGVRGLVDCVAQRGKLVCGVRVAFLQLGRHRRVALRQGLKPVGVHSLADCVAQRGKLVCGVRIAFLQFGQI